MGVLHGISRKRTAKNHSRAGENNIASGQGILGNATNVANSEVNTSGGLSPLVGKQLANEEGQIGKAYQGQHKPPFAEIRSAGWVWGRAVLRPA